MRSFADAAAKRQHLIYVERRRTDPNAKCVEYAIWNETKQIQISNKHKFVKFEIGRYARQRNDVNERKITGRLFRVNLIVDHKLNELLFLRSFYLGQKGSWDCIQKYSLLV